MVIEGLAIHLVFPLCSARLSRGSTYPQSIAAPQPAEVSVLSVPVTLSLCRWILGIRAPLVKTKLLLVKFELGPLQACWKFSDL